jgi:hypothetical protein
MFWLKHNNLLHEAFTLLVCYPLPTYEGLNYIEVESWCLTTCCTFWLIQITVKQVQLSEWEALQTRNAKVLWDPRFLSCTLSTVKLKIYRKLRPSLKIRDIHFAKYVQRCKGKLSSQNQDQHINKRSHHITPNQINYIKPVIPLWVTKWSIWFSTNPTSEWSSFRINSATRPYQY